MNINLILYGAFRQLGVNQISLEVPELSSVAELRDSLEKYLEALALNSNIKISGLLIKASVFATDEYVLKESDKIGSLKSLAIFPPVCGG